MSEFHKNPATKELCPTPLSPIPSLVTAKNFFCMISHLLLPHAKSFEMLVC